MEKDLYKVGKALLELSDLDQPVKRVHRVREGEPRKDKKSVKQRERPV